MRTDLRLAALSRAFPPRTPSTRAIAVPLTRLDAPAPAIADTLLRPGSWATTPAGVALISEMLTSVSVSAKARMTPSADGLLELHLETPSGRTCLTFDADATRDDVRALLCDERNGRSATRRLRGSLSEILAAAQAPSPNSGIILPARTPAGATRGALLVRHGRRFARLSTALIKTVIVAVREIAFGASSPVKGAGR